MENQESYLEEELPQQAVFALDIGTHSIIGMVGFLDGDRIHIVAIEQMKHTKRAMVDGQIQDISQVAKVAGIVKDKLEKRLGCRLTRVAVAAAGRALRTEKATYEMELPSVERISPEIVSRLEAGAIDEAEKAFTGEAGGDLERHFYLVGYSASRYYLDDYIFSSLLDHRGKKLKVDIIATFLPSEVVESLYSAMNKINLEVASLTLEPIAAINAAIPPSIRLLNLAMVDIGAGTSDIAVCRDGSITGYTMAVQAGDEITEVIMKEYLVDFQEAERIKSQADVSETIEFTDIMGFDQAITREQLLESMKDASASLCDEICSKIVEINGGVPSAVFLAGGGSLLSGLKERIADKLQIDPKRIAIAGRNFKENAFSEEYDLDNPEYTTPLGIMVSAGLNMINDSFRVILNGHQAKLFRSGTFTVMDILMMNGYSYQDMMGRSGQNLGVSLNGQRKLIFGEKAEPCVLRLNGQEARMSALVRAGDSIDFIPAKRGQDASVRLSQLVSIESGRSISVNGEPVASDLDLKSGDVILVEGLSWDSEENGTMGIEKPEDRKNTNHDSVHGTSSAADQEGENIQDTEAEPVSVEGGHSDSGEEPEASESIDSVTAFAQTESTAPKAKQNKAAETGETGETPAPKQRRPSRSAGRSKKTIVEEMTDGGGIESVQMELSLDGLEKNPEAPLVTKKKRASSTAGGKKASATVAAEKKEAAGTASRRKKGTAESVFRRIEGLGPAELLPQEVENVEPAEPASQGAEGVGPAEPASQEAKGVGPAEPLFQGAKGVGLAEPVVQGAENVEPAEPLFQGTEGVGPAKPLFQGAKGVDLAEPAESLFQRAEGVGPAEPASGKTEGLDVKAGRGVMLYLNDQRLFLPPKADGQPYYLMDMLQYSGLDLKNLTNPVELEVNGGDGAFQMELKSGDRIRIYEKHPGISGI